jgi:protoporphyrinogen oxidase
VKVLVIGAGATGLAVAYLASRAGVQVTVVEAAPRAGGLLSTFDVGDRCLLEHFYHHFFTHDAEICWLLRELGLEERIEYRDTSMGVFRDGRLYPFNGAGDLLAFRPLRLVDRLRFGLSSALLASFRGYADREDIACLDWFDRWAGRAATDAIWRPLVESKFAAAAQRIPLAWMAGRLRQRARSRKRGREQLGYLAGSLQVLVDRLGEVLAAEGVEMILGQPVAGIVMENGRAAGVRTDRSQIRADLVVSTVPTPILAEWLRPIRPAYAERLARIRYLGAICTILSLDEPLSDVYWTNVTDPGYDFSGLIEHTNLVPAAHYGRQHLVYLSRYLSVDDPLWKLSDESLLDRQLFQLEAMFGRSLRPRLQRHWIFRTRFAATLTEMGFSRLIPAMKSPLPNLYVTSMCHIYPDERSVNNSIRVAAELIRALGYPAIADAVPRGLSLSARYGASDVLRVVTHPGTCDSAEE